MSPYSTRRVILVNSLILSCLVAACGGGGGEDPADLETAQGRRNKAATTTTATTPTTTTSTTTTTPSNVLADGSLAWSSPLTWGGTLPTAGAEVVIPAGKVITLDATPPNLAGLRIEGTLRFARSNINLNAAFIDLTGALEIGTAAQPFAQKAIITLTGAPQAVNDGVSRGLNVRGGRIELYGAVPQPVWTKLNDHAQAGATALTLKDTVTNWRAGDTIAVAPTDFYGVAATERLTLSGATGTQLALSTPLAKFRWGKMQYVTNMGMSLTPDPTFVPPATPSPTELDERAAVGNLSRNIVIQGVDDSAWQTTGFGAHMMIMNLASKVTVDGVEFRRVGQAGNLARYPIHWHLLSYGGDGLLLGDAIGHNIKNSSIWQSAQRCVVIHGTNGVQVLNNICQDIKGHAFFLEDAVERRNVFDGNLALMVRPPNSTQRVLASETPTFKRGPSGFWLTNPDNIVRNNLAADAQGNGFWMAFPRKPQGLSTAVAMLPDRLPHGVFASNTAHSNLNPGLLFDFAPTDAAGNTAENKYIPTANGAEDNYSNRLRFELKGIITFKNNDGGYRNRVSAPDYVEWVSADNVGTFFEGAGDSGVITRGLFVGTSLNSASRSPDVSRPPVAFATYHSTFSMKYNTLVNFPFVPGVSSGAFRADDYYTNAVEMGTKNNTNNRYIATAHGFRTLPPNMDGKTLSNRNWTYAGALLDASGVVGPAGNYWVYDVPFLTSGRNCQLVAPAGQNGASCSGAYYGVGGFRTDFDDSQYQFMAAIDVRRVDSSGNEIGSWGVANGKTSTMLGWMRHFAANTAGDYVLKFPDFLVPKRVAFGVSNLNLPSDGFVVAVAFDGALTAGANLIAGHKEGDLATWPSTDSRWQYVRKIRPGANLAEVKASTGEVLWQDRINNLVWVKVQGGLPYPTPWVPAGTPSQPVSEIIKNHRLAIFAQ